MDIYVCKNGNCAVHTFYGDKGFYSLECPLCNHDDIKKGNRANENDKEVNDGNHK